MFLGFQPVSSESREHDDLMNILASSYLDACSEACFTYSKPRLVNNELLEKEVKGRAMAPRRHFSRRRPRGSVARTRAASGNSAAAFKRTVGNSQSTGRKRKAIKRKRFG